jgi:hypothetical protein
MAVLGQCELGRNWREVPAETSIFTVSERKNPGPWPNELVRTPARYADFGVGYLHFPR